MKDAVAECFLAALKAVEAQPRPLLPRAQLEAEERGVDVDLEALRELLQTGERGKELRTRLHLRLGAWDAVAEAPWAAGTSPRSAQRRQRIYEKSGLTPLAAHLDSTMAVHGDTTVVIDAGSVTPWYPHPQLSQREFYWPHYRDYLAAQGWGPQMLLNLDDATTQVVERLARPDDAGQYSSRGLVVGHVQSGKTANFTGSIAKAIDAGYRLVIVLTGTIEILRRQTQRRLDQELVGVENITLGLAPDDPDALAQVEYRDDPDWIEGNWMRHGTRPSLHGFPDIIRLTTRDDDYRELAQGIRTLELRKNDKSRPLYDPANLFASDALVAVVKKQTHRLDALLTDLRRVSTQLREIPALILDDESDQASINTTNPKKWTEGQTERTSINERVTDLLKLLPRGQYVGYTATPFANVFVDPADGEDLFPRDFLLSLTPPEQYMGITAFHDEDGAAPKEATYATSSERAHVRNLVATEPHDREAELAAALDAFVLAGAVKLFREDQMSTPGRFRHHTMLVHESVRTSEHRAMADRIQWLWDAAEFTSSAGLLRLQRLWEDDFAPVSAARADGAPVPKDFRSLIAFVAVTVARVCAAGRPPYIVVNGEKDINKEDVAFNQHPVWRVLVGGTSLSRGFTVEGLTISYYRRRTGAGDTTMQMGRWFGYRPDYRDLVRLYIGRNEPGARGNSIDLYDTFRGLMKDEEDFRAELARYAERVEGGPEFKLTPRDIPPLVSQHLPQLPPTSRNKMYNAELDVRRFAGKGQEPNAWATTAKDIEHNYDVMTELVARAQEPFIGDGAVLGAQQYLHTLLTNQELLATMSRIRWLRMNYWRPELAYLQELQDTGRVQEWLLLMPQSRDLDLQRDLPGIGLRTVYRRARRPERGNVLGFVSTNAHRKHVDALLARYADIHPTRGILLCYPVHVGDLPEQDESLRGHLTLVPYMQAPDRAVPADGALIRFRVKDPTRADQAIIDTSTT